MCLSPVNTNGNVSIRRAQFLVEPAVGTDPQVILCDFHLEKTTAQQSATEALRVKTDRLRIQADCVRLLTAQRKPEPGMESKPSSSLVMEIM